MQKTAHVVRAVVSSRSWPRPASKIGITRKELIATDQAGQSPKSRIFWGGRGVQSVGPFARRTTGGDGDVLAGNRPVPKGHQCHEAFTAQHNMDMFKAAIGRPEGIKPMDQAAAGLAVPA